VQAHRLFPPEKAIEKAWDENGNSIYRGIELVARGIGDIRNRAPSQLRTNLYLIRGDLLLSDFEDRVGDTWNAAKGGTELALRVQSAIYRTILQAAEKVGADVVLVDLGPNLGALNWAVLGGSDYVIVPVAPDLFSIKGAENLGGKLATWRKEWDQCNAAWAGNGLEIPKGRPSFLGYVMQQHNIRDNASGMTQGSQIFGNQLESAIQVQIVDRLNPLGQVHNGNGFNLGKIPNLHSLIPYSLKARKSVFQCTSSDGLKGAHLQRAKDSKLLFKPIADAISGVLP